jgi:anti-sigma regulatory factor (Ser/Thr protein kinase)
VNPAASDPAQRFTLELPPEAAYVATARMFSSAVARHFDAGEDAIQDLKLAVSEVWTGALRDGVAGDESLRITARHQPPALRFEVARPEADTGRPDDRPGPDQVAAGLGLEIVRALFEDADLARSEDGEVVVRFSVPLPA